MKDKKRLKRSTPNARSEPPRSTLKARSSVRTSTLNTQRSKLRSSSAPIVGVGGSVLDSTEQNQAEEALRQSEKQFRALFDQTTGGIVRTDLTGRFTLVNDRFCGIVGRSREELLTLRMHDITHSDDVAANVEQFRALVQGGPSFVVEMRYLRQDGSMVWVHNEVAAMRDSGGRVTHVVAAVTDITDRKQAESILVAQNHLLEQIASGSPLDEILAELCVAVPTLNPRARACILLVDDKRKNISGSIGPDLAPAFGAALRDAPINNRRIGTCGEAIYFGRPVMCVDVTKDERWSKMWRDLCLSCGVRAGYSNPILGADGLPLGSFLLCFGEPHQPDAWELKLAEFGAHIAGIAIERDRLFSAAQQETAQRTRAEALLATGRNVLELIATGWPLSDVLDALMREIEAQSTDGMLCSILLLDETGQKLLHGAAPSLPPAYNAAVHGLIIGPSAGSCGTAAFERKPVFVTDIAADPRWANAKDLAAAYGLGACCSTPILSGQDELLGTVAMYYRQPHNPSQADRELIGRAAQLAGIAIERDRVEKALRESEERFRSLVSNIPGVVYRCACDSDWTMEFLSDPIEQLCGYPASDFLASRVRSYNSVIHPNDRQMVERVVLDAVAQRQSYTIEYRLLHKDGGIRWVYEKGQGIFAADGHVLWLDGAIFDITERKRTEEALRLAKFSMDRAADAVYWIDPQAKVLDVNEAASRMLGYSKDELCAMTVHDLNPEFQADMWPGFWAETRKRGTMVFETCHQAKNGRRIPIEVSVNFLSYEGKEYHCAFVRDITERKRVETALQASKARFRAIFDQTFQFIGLMETDGTLIEANRSALQFAGIREEDVLGKLFWDTPWWTHSPDLQNRLREAVRQASGGAMVRFEATHPSSTGQLAYVDFSLKPVRDEHGNVTLLIPEGRDITERKQVEAALRESEERYHSIFENAVEGIFQTTADGKYIAVNPALARIYGYDSPDDMIATITDIASQLYVDPGRRDEFLCLMQAQEEVTGFEALVYRKDGSFIWISESARTLRDQAGTVVAYEGTVEDITERKRAEGRLRATLDHVRTLSGRLAAMQEEERTHIARELHDELGVRLTCLKIDLSRLMSIVGNRVRADLRVKLNDRVRSMVGQVDSTIASLQQLVTQLRPALLDDLGLVAAIEWQSQDFQKRTGISCICETSTDDIAMEPERATAVFRICQEALTNTARHAQATAVTVTVTSQPDSLKLVVADNGVGVPNTKALDPRSLGLIGMQERAAQCGGTLTIEGDPQKGTTVTLYLPVGGGDSLNHRGIHAESSGGR